MNEASQESKGLRSEKVDLNDLEWEDRERVLRLLFSKMNAGVAPAVLMQRVGVKKQTTRQQEMKQISEMGVYMEQQEEDESIGEGEEPLAI